jgi:hypothetical protein
MTDPRDARVREVLEKLPKRIVWCDEYRSVCMTNQTTGEHEWYQVNNPSVQWVRVDELEAALAATHLAAAPQELVCVDCQHPADRHSLGYEDDRCDCGCRSRRFAPVPTRRGTEAPQEAEAVTALRMILTEPHGCPTCDSGKLRNPSKEHWPECGFARATAVLAAVPPVGEPPELKMTKCPKCSGVLIIGPRYRSNEFPPYRECLGYTCSRCGFAWFTPTDDAGEPPKGEQ